MNIMYLVIGIIIGIVAMAYLAFLNAAHNSFHKIEWHDAQQESPSLYINDDEEPRFVRVLIATKKGCIIDSTYYPDINHYDYELRKNITHFAYIDEIKLTVPPCPVCSGDFLNDPYNPHYAVPSNL